MMRKYECEWKDGVTTCNEQIIASSPKRAAWQLASGADYVGAVPSLISAHAYKYYYDAEDILAVATVCRGYRKYLFHFLFK